MPAYSLLRQDDQIRKSSTYDDTIAFGLTTLVSNAVVIEDDLNALRSQIKRILGTANWYTDVSVRNLSTVEADLADIEAKKVLFRTDLLTDIVVPSAVSATDTLTASGAIADGNTVTIGGQTYTFKSPFVNAANNIDASGTTAQALDNLKRAINGDGVAGTNYGTGTAVNTSVTATNSPTTVVVTAILAGAVGNAIAVSSVGANIAWGTAKLQGGAGDIVILSAAGLETPTEVAAVALTQVGAVVKQSTFSTSAFNVHELIKVTGQNAISPKNLCVVRDATNGEYIQSSGRDVYALLQYESTGVDGAAFNDTSGGNRAKLSFVRENATFDNLEAVPAADIAGKSINYSYVLRINFDAIPEDAFITDANFVDQSASVDVTLDRAIDNQGVTPATQLTDIHVQIADTKFWAFDDDAGSALFKVIANNPGTSTVEVGSATDVFDVNAASNDFAEGATFDSAGTALRVGVTAGYVDTAASDLGIRAGLELYLDDGNQTGSTWSQTAGIKLSDTTLEWDNFEAAFGEVSLLNAIYQAKTSSNRSKRVAAVTAITINPNVNVTGAAGPNIDLQLQDYSAVNFLTDVDIFVNGQLQRNGANSGANFDVYPGTTPANGDLMFEYKLRQNDVITMIVFGA